MDSCTPIAYLDYWNYFERLATFTQRECELKILGNFAIAKKGK